MPTTCLISPIFGVFINLIQWPYFSGNNRIDQGLLQYGASLLKLCIGKVHCRQQSNHRLVGAINQQTLF
jgi:hypothetical protein